MRTLVGDDWEGFHPLTNLMVRSKNYFVLIDVVLTLSVSAVVTLPHRQAPHLQDAPRSSSRPFTTHHRLARHRLSFPTSYSNPFLGLHLFRTLSSSSHSSQSSLVKNSG